MADGLARQGRAVRLEGAAPRLWRDRQADRGAAEGVRGRCYGGAPLAALAAATAVQAQQTRTDTIYRCTNALGALTIQNGIPCPKGSKQEVQVVESQMVIPNYESPPQIVH